MKPGDIKALRKRLGLSQEKFAFEVGVSTNSVHFWEKGSRKPLEMAIRKLRALDLETKPRSSINDD